MVNVMAATCSCPDFEIRRRKCKHLWAVELVKTVETAADGSQVVTESVKVTRKTYTQDWPAYHAAQCAEKETVQKLLRDLCDGVWTAPHPGRGRKPIAVSDAAYAMTMKVYTTVSGRRASTDIKECAEDGLMGRAPSYNSVFDYFDKPEMTPILVKLIEQSARNSERNGVRRKSRTLVLSAASVASPRNADGIPTCVNGVRLPAPPQASRAACVVEGPRGV